MKSNLHYLDTVFIDYIYKINLNMLFTIKTLIVGIKWRNFSFMFNRTRAANLQAFS